MSNSKSCGCSSASQFDSRNFTFRSNTSVNSSDKEMSNFLGSADYKAYKVNFPKAPIMTGHERLVTFNNTTIQALWLPAISTDKEKQVLFTLYKLGQTNYLTFVVNSKGSLSNRIDMSGTFNWMLTNKAALITGTFSKNQWNTLSVANIGTTGVPAELPNGGIIGCIGDTISNMGLGTAIACVFDIEACILVIAIDCAWSAL